MGAKLLLVGLDAADHDLAVTWAERGRLPTLQRLRRTGTWGTLTSPPGLGDDAAWASFSTSVGPGHHGRFYHERFQAYTPTPCRRDAFSLPPFWEQLAKQGRRVAVIDVPKSPLGAVGEGLVIADWMCHEPDGRVLVTSPSPLGPELGRWFVRDPGFVCHDLHRSAAQTADYEGRLIKRATVRSDALCSLLRAQQWDLFLAVFAETHCVGHECWHHHDLEHPAHVPSSTQANGDVVERVYREVDARLAELIDAAGPDAVVIVFSLLGMGPNYSGTHLLEAALARLEGRSATPTAMAAESLSRLRNRLPPRLHQLVPAALRRANARLRSRDMTSRSFWVLPTDLPTSAIRCNQVGREPHGRVGAGREFEDACHDLREQLLSLEDPETHTALVRSVVLTNETYAGQASDDFADVLVTWAQTRPITAAYSRRIGLVRGHPPADCSGNHRQGGWFVAAGAGIASSLLEGSCSVMDLAPTAAARLGVTLDGAHGDPIVALTSTG